MKLKSFTRKKYNPRIIRRIDNINDKISVDENLYLQINKMIIRPRE